MRWVTKDGRHLSPSDMTAEHLRNAAAMLRRKSCVTPDEFASAWGSASSMRGEMASYYAEQYAADLVPSEMLAALEDELEGRYTEGTRQHATESTDVGLDAGNAGDIE